MARITMKLLAGDGNDQEHSFRGAPPYALQGLPCAMSVPFPPVTGAIPGGDGNVQKTPLHCRLEWLMVHAVVLMVLPFVATLLGMAHCSLNSV